MGVSVCGAPSLSLSLSATRHTSLHSFIVRDSYRAALQGGELGAAGHSSMGAVCMLCYYDQKVLGDASSFRSERLERLS